MYNNLYNFKNPIRHFIDVDNLTYPRNIGAYVLNDMSWTKPIKFNVRKERDSFRTLKMPNLLIFAASYEKFKNMPNFMEPNRLDCNHKRLKVNIAIGEFEIGSYEDSLKEDFERLCVYDILLKLDIKEFYGRIYTHYLDYSGIDEHFLTNLNSGATNGLIMGNYISLYFAEQQLAKIAEEIQNSLNEQHLNCEFNYFSDDFYFFCNDNDKTEIIECFDRVLAKFDLERNIQKIEEWNYSSYNDYNVVERFWKRIIAECNKVKQPETDYRLVFINQIIYRLSRLSDYKQKRILMTGFFRTKYFRKDFNLEKATFREYDIHQLCFLFRENPEVFLYCADLLPKIKNFCDYETKFRKFFTIRYVEALKKSYHEEQLYYFYVMSLWGYDDLLKNSAQLVMRSENQVLISYYIVNDWFDTLQMQYLKSETGEDKWFQNYHLIMFSADLRADIDASIDTYLVPKDVSKLQAKNNFRSFYKTNILNNTLMIRKISDVCTELHDYLDLRFEAAEARYGS